VSDPTDGATISAALYQQLLALLPQETQPGEFATNAQGELQRHLLQNRTAILSLLDETCRNKKARHHRAFCCQLNSSRTIQT